MDKSAKEQFIEKVKIVTSIVTVTLLLILLIIYSVKVFLLIFAGAMVAVFFRAIAGFLSRKTGLETKWTLPTAILSVLGIWVLMFFLLQPQVTKQVDTLKKQLPQAAKKVESKMKQSNTGRFILRQLPFANSSSSSSASDSSNGSSGEETAGGGQGNNNKSSNSSGSNSKKGSKNLQGFFKKFFSTTLGVLGDLYVIFLLGMFFTANPAPYKKGIVKLFPKEKRKRTSEVIEATGITLKLWLFGKMISMLIVAILTFFGLWMLGVPLFITLALFAGLVSFIPNFGPIIAIIPAFLVGFAQSPSMGLYVILLYIGVQVVESNLITPFIMKKQINIPMAMTLFSQILLALLVGGLGLIFATPIVAMFIVIIQMVYIEDILGDKSIDVKGERLAKENHSG